MNEHQTFPLNKDKENKINFSDLIYYILIHWRVILLGAIIAGLLLFGCDLIKGFNSLESQNHLETQKAYERSYEEYRIMKTQLEDQLVELTQAIKEKEDYQHQSILMNLNPNTAYKSKLTYVVNDIADTQAFTDLESSKTAKYTINSILGSYASLIREGEVLQNISKKINTEIDEKYINELVYVQVDYQSKLLHITVLGDDKKQAQDISDAIEKEIQDANLKINKALGFHRLELISSYIGNDADTSILIGAIPTDGKNENGSYQTSIENMQEDNSAVISDLQNQLINCNNQLNELEEPIEPKEASRDTVIKRGIKFGVIGFIVGAVLVAYCFALKYVACGKLMTSDEMQEDYGIPVLMKYKAPKRINPNLIDKLINCGFGITESSSCLQERFDLAVANVLARIEKTDNVKILFIGNANVCVFESAVSSMAETLNTDGIEVISAGNINENENAVRKLPSAEKIVLIEQTGVSRKKDIKKELLTLRDLKKEIVGAIVL